MFKCTKCLREFKTKIGLGTHLGHGCVGWPDDIRNKKLVLLAERGHKCWECGRKNWRGKPITLELDHIDGNSDNDDRVNLRILCLLCHSQTETFRGKNVGAPISKRRRALEQTILNRFK